MSNTLADRLKPLFEDAAANGADVHFLVGKGKEKELLSAHKLLLQIASDVFKAMFRFDAINSEKEIGSVTNPVLVTDVEAGAFKTMLKFIYTDELDEMNGDTFFEVLYAAKKYNVTALIKKCTEYPVEKLNNVFETLLSARFFEEHDFASHCLYYIDQNAETLFQSDVFLQIDQKLLCEILGRDELMADEWNGIWKAALRWADGQCRRKSIDCSAENRRRMLGPALFQIRFPLISKDQFAADIVPSGVLTIDEMFRVFLHHCNPSAAGSSVVPHKHKQYPVHFSAKPRANWPTIKDDLLKRRQLLAQQLQQWMAQRRQQQQQLVGNGILASLSRQCNRVKVAAKKVHPGALFLFFSICFLPQFFVFLFTVLFAGAPLWFAIYPFAFAFFITLFGFVYQTILNFFDF